MFTFLGWLGAISLLIGLWYIGKKKRWAFMFQFAGELLILVQSVHMRAWSIAFIGVTFSSLAVRNYILWGRAENNDK